MSPLFVLEEGILEEKPIIHDALGIKPLGEAIKAGTEALVRQAEAIISKICYPPAEELGLLLKDHVSNWRARNSSKMLIAANELIDKNDPDPQKRIHPKLLNMAIQESSWIEEEEIQKTWAGLLTSSTSIDGKSDENLIFMNLLKQMSCLEVKILKHGVENSHKFDNGYGLVISTAPIFVSLDQLKSLFQCDDLTRLDRELDHLREIGLIRTGINPETNMADLQPTALGINLYVRAQGSKKTAVEYFNLGRLPDLTKFLSPDPNLKERLEGIEKKARELLYKAIIKWLPKGTYPPEEQLVHYSIENLFQFGSLIGPPKNLFFLTAHSIFNHKNAIPLISDPDWKKANVLKDYEEFEKQVDNFSKQFEIQ